MNITNKGKSPFYPGQPVPIEFFIGRINEIQRITRSINQVELGKPQAIFLTGEYGIGKSSLAGFMKYLAEKNNSILGIHVFLGNVETVEDLAIKTVETTIKTPIYELTISEKIGNFLAKYIGKQDLFGFNINLEVLKADGPNLSQGYLPFLHELLNWSFVNLRSH
ncbi:MAG: ATP-binding protein [bacterium]